MGPSLMVFISFPQPYHQSYLWLKIHVLAFVLDLKYSFLRENSFQIFLLFLAIWILSSLELGCYIICIEILVDVNRLTVEVEVDQQEVVGRGESTR